MTIEYWRRDVHADRRPFLLQRGRIKAGLRAWFEAEGFIETEIGAMQMSPGNETHLQAFASDWQEEGEPPQRRYLHTSPEFAAKKLLAAGEERIVDFARVWRNGETGPLHSPEFTMVEWYRTNVPYAAVMADSVALCRAALAAAGRPRLEWREASCDPGAAPETITVSEAFDAHAGIDLGAMLEDRDALAAATAALGLTVFDDDNWSDLFSKIIVTHVEPRMGDGQLSLLTEYPIAEAALARPCAHDPRFAERFEMYACGVELANGFGELTDADEQRRRFEAEMDEKQRIYGDRYPIDEDLLTALRTMPDASGVALGFDRLAMLASGARHINDVLWTPFPA
jgi:lysyl-tRNA synthetase class 2